MRLKKTPNFSLLRAALVVPIILGAACDRAGDPVAPKQLRSKAFSGDSEVGGQTLGLAPSVEVGPTRYTSKEIFIDALSTGAVTWKWEQLAGPGIISFSSPDTEDTSVTANRDGFYWLRLTAIASDGTESFDDVQMLWDTIAPCPTLTPEVKTFKPTLVDGHVPKDAVTIAWSQISGPGIITFSNAAASETTIGADIDGTYGIRLTATDKVGNQCAQDLSFIWETTVPSVAVGPDLFANKEILIDAASVEGRTFSWIQVSGPGTVSFSNPNQEDTRVSANVDGEYVLRLTITTSVGLVAFDELTLRWDTSAPVVDLGPDLSRRYRAIVDAQVSEAKNFIWKKVSGPGKITFASEDTEDTAFVANLAGTYVVSLTASDLAGNETTANLTVDFEFDTRVFAKGISSGGSHSCAIMDDDTVSCWGYNYAQELGYGDENKYGEGIDRYNPPSFPIKLGAAKTATSLSANYAHSCAILDDGSVKCWGQNTSGQLGMGDNKKLNQPANAPINLGGLKARAIATGLSHTCAILENDSLKCWGANSAGQLGYGDYSARTAPPALAVDLGAGRSAKSMSLGAYHTCVILDNDKVKCWGNNANGQLGLGDKNYRNKPDQEIAFAGGLKTREITTGAYHTCAVLENGAAYCWGRGKQGQLGYGDLVDRLVSEATPLPLAGARLKQVSAGLSHTCALFENNEIKCWGANDEAQLGVGGGVMSQPSMAAASAVPLAGAGVLSVSAGRLHTCALLDDATMKCWGSNSYGQLGAGRAYAGQTPPTTVIKYELLP